MALDILESLKGVFNDGITAMLGRCIGEEPSRTESALEAAFPAILGGLVGKGSSIQGAAEIHETIRRKGFGQDTLTGLERTFAGGYVTRESESEGAALLEGIFGDKVPAVVDLVSGASGMGKTAAASLLGLVTPAVLAALGREARARSLNVPGLMGLLSSQMEPLKAQAPPGLGGVLGLLELSDVPGAPIVSGFEPPKKASAGWKWAFPLAIVTGALVFMLKTCEMPPSPEVRSPEPGKPAGGAGDNAAAGGAAQGGAAGFLPLKLPGGAALSVPPAGVEKKLVDFIADPGRPVDKTTWFTFDRLEFETGSAALKPSSAEQLGNVAAILKAYPGVALKIGGYTDNVGNPAANRKLSQARAVNTRDALVKLGIDAKRLEAEGYGDAHPVADNSTEEGRQRNRRIDLRVTRK